MFLITTVRISTGYRLLVAVPNSAPCYQWRLYRNGHPLAPPVITMWLDNVIAFDLHFPLAPGLYALRLSVDDRESLLSGPALPVIRAGLVTNPMTPPVAWNWTQAGCMRALQLPI